MSGRAGIAIGAIAALISAAAAPPAAAESAEPRIVGGQVTTIEEWPWQVAVAEPPDGQNNGFQRQFCGGSLVAPTVVVTAAHCVYDFTAPSLCAPTDGFHNPASEFSVIAGRTTLSSSAGAEIPVTELYYFDVGPGGAAQAEAQSTGDGQGLYECSTNRWDVAILELASAAPPPAAAIKIAGGDEGATWQPGRDAFATGWGATSEGGPGSDTLREVGLSMLADSTCAGVYGSGYDPQTMLCAGELAGGRDACQGDSGGPLVVPINGGGMRLVGDTSFGAGCARPNTPAVYGRLTGDPIRSALRGAVLQIAGIDPVGSGARPPSPPETTITDGPKKKTKTGRRRAKATFRFHADEPARFQCRLDRNAFKSCTSPAKVRVKEGKHTFRVRAIDQDGGNVDPKAARFAWKVVRR
jgi:hypothetical protein